MGLLRKRRDSNANNNDDKKRSAISARAPWLPSVPRFLKKKKIVPKQDVDGARNLSANFCEHTWDEEKLLVNHENSNINFVKPMNSRGLSSTEAAARLARDGPNALPKPKEISDIALFLRQFLNLLWILLIVTDIMCLIAFFADTTNKTQLWVTIIIAVMILGMCCISFYHEREALKVVRGFQNLLPDTCTVIRDGKEMNMSAETLVVGDIILIKNGTRVPADARLLSCKQLKLETSSITGEAEPIDYSSEAVSESTTIFDAHNVAFNGSLCVDGEGIAIVIRVGVQTVIGQIASLTTGQRTNTSQLQIQIRRFVIFLIIAATSVGLIVFIVGGFVHQWNISPIVLLANAFLVCAISLVPTGMPATVTSIIALVARRLAKKNVFLKRLDIVEALGAVDIIASDKTGTLTKNIMTVTDAWFYDEVIHGRPDRQTTVVPGHKRTLEHFSQPIGNLLEIMAVCNVSKFVEDEQPKTILEMPKTGDQGLRIENMAMKPASGSPSEVAMLRYCDTLISIDDVRAAFKGVFEVPFNSKRKWHLMIEKRRELDNGMAEYRLLMKGASEILIQKCSHILTRNGPSELDQDALGKFQDAYQTFGSNGRRVIGFAQKTFFANANTEFDLEKENFPTQELEFVGVCAIMDPPRDETAMAIKQCRSAGIRVFMVTGDHHLTAAAIAREIDLIRDDPTGPKDYEILHGESITHLPDAEWDRVLKKQAVVFARTTPEQKLLIVEQCQKRKFNIAMTGDGVNDSPALKRADIGIAMGSGSDVAKQAADVILMDDNFSSIVRAVQEGRMMFDNIKKLLAYVALHATPEMWPIILTFIGGMPLGISSLQIMAIDLGTDIPPGIALAREPMEGDLMERPPRGRDKYLSSYTLLAFSYLYAGFMESLGCFFAYLTVYLTHGIAIGDLFMSDNTFWKVTSPDFVSNNNVYTAAQQVEIQKQSCSAWQMGIVVGQIFGLLVVRTRRQSIFTHGIFSNMQAVGASVLSVVLVCMMIYIPGVNTFFGGAAIGPAPWGVAFAWGLVILAFNEGRKFLIRRMPKNPIVHMFKW